MSKLPLNSSRQLTGDVVVALESVLSGTTHVAAAAAPQQGWLMDGGPYVPDPCRGHDRIGCHVASQIRVVRRVLGLAQGATSVTFVSRTAEVSNLLTGWLNGKDDMPDWYSVPTNVRGRRRPALERARLRIQAFPEPIAAVPPRVGHHDTALEQAAELKAIALNYIRGKCTADTVKKLADTIVGL